MRSETSTLGVKKVTLSTMLVLSVFLLFWCSNNNKMTIDMDKTNDLAWIMAVTSEVAQEYARWVISLEEFERISAELESKYEELAGIDIDELKDSINDSMEDIQEVVEENIANISFPKRANDRWLSEPKWMEMNLEESNTSTKEIEWFDSIIMIYEWDYETALSEAKRIAENAGISISPEFKAAQEMLAWMTEEEKSDLDVLSKDMAKGVVYANHSLLETDFDRLITISVDELWKMIIEAINYAQMEK